MQRPTDKQSEYSIQQIEIEYYILHHTSSSHISLRQVIRMPPNQLFNHSQSHPKLEPSSRYRWIENQNTRILLECPMKRTASSGCFFVLHGALRLTPYEVVCLINACGRIIGYLWKSVNKECCIWLRLKNFECKINWRKS